MTERTEGSVATPIEQATRDVLEMIQLNADSAHEEHRLATPTKGYSFTRSQFKRVLALYFHDKTLAEWCRDLGIPDASDPSDKPEGGGRI